ncbi:toxin-antitoxin system YwqK family antitoxin [Saccharicrinis sp. FJH2]|uniref:toxin-antitoxin system YwqK family antitoxin n=1 Tax=Saccharicrinis sp. FJH65 TaxID=3344659 RepID=UPI0035F2CC1B
MAVLLNKIIQRSQLALFVLTVPFTGERNCHDTIPRERCKTFKNTLQTMNMTLKYRLTQLTFIGMILLTVSCVQKRERDSDEIVLNEMVIEKNGIYYEGDCEIHAKEKFTGECKFYHDNSKLKGVVYIEKGLPTGHWKYWDSTGLKTLDLFYDKGKLIKKEKPTPEINFPWTKSVTKTAIGAILTSIQNIKNDSLYHGNFPADINNMPFIRTKKSDFEIIGYETSTSTPEKLKIDFHPINEYKSGPRFTVEINIISEQAIRVYMTPDA